MIARYARILVNTIRLKLEVQRVPQRWRGVLETECGLKPAEAIHTQEVNNKVIRRLRRQLVGLIKRAGEARRGNGPQPINVGAGEGGGEVGAAAECEDSDSTDAPSGADSDGNASDGGVEALAFVAGEDANVRVDFNILEHMGLDPEAMPVEAGDNGCENYVAV